MNGHSDDKNRMTKELCSSMVDISHRLYAENYVVATSGNISVRTKEGFLITPRARRKDSLRIESIVACRASGDPIDSRSNPSSEAAMHSLAYEMRPDVNAVIHAHPRFCLACSLANILLEKPYLAEQAFYTGPIYTVPFAVPGSKEVCDAIKQALSQYNSFILERHGVLVLGSDLEHAYNRLEQMEYVADVVYHAVAVNKIEPFSADDLERIRRSGSSHYTK